MLIAGRGLFKVNGMVVVRITAYRDGLHLLFSRDLVPALFDNRNCSILTTGFWTNLLGILNSTVRKEIPRSELHVLDLLNVDRAIVYDPSTRSVTAFTATSNTAGHLSGKCSVASCDSHA